LFGHTATFGKRFWEIPRVEVERRALEAHLERLQKELPFFDLEIARSDERGARQVHIISGQSRRGADGTFLGYWGVGRDVTGQRDGGWKWLHAKGRVTERDAAGRARRMSGIVADIEARKRAEAAMSTADQRFRDVAAVSSEYVWEADAEWRYTYLSERVEALLGYARSELLGRRAWDFVPLGEERAVRQWFASHGGEGQPFRDLVHRVMTKSGGVLWQSV